MEACEPLYFLRMRPKQKVTDRFRFDDLHRSGKISTLGKQSNDPLDARLDDSSVVHASLQNRIGEHRPKMRIKFWLPLGLSRKANTLGIIRHAASQ